MRAVSGQRRLLDGWRRIGVILSVVWFIGFAGYIWSWDRQETASFYAMQLSLCSAAHRMVAQSLEGRFSDPAWGDKRDREEAANDARYEKCQAEARNFYSSQIGENAGWARWALGLALLFGVDLLTIVFGWLIAWFFILMVRWVQRGFSAST